MLKQSILKTWLKVRPDVGGRDLFINGYGNPINYSSMETYHNRHLKKLGLFESPEPGSTRSRSGRNIHEIRDFFKTRFHLSHADLLVADFCMGHDIDPLGYDKAMRDESYVRNEYRKAEPWLNFRSQDPQLIPIDQYENVLRQNDELEKKVKLEFVDIRAELRKMRGLGGE
jgi:hypothetical protein